MVDQKVLQVIHYICDVANGLPLGAVRLNKILWFAEKDHFLCTLRPMLGLEFVKGPFGPLPPVAATACRHLADTGAIAMEERDYGTYRYVDMRPLRRPTPSLLSEEEQAALRNLTWEICTEHTARSISDLTHNSLYHMLSMGEDYPLEFSLMEKARPATSSEIAELMQGID